MPRLCDTRVHSSSSASHFLIIYSDIWKLLLSAVSSCVLSVVPIHSAVLDDLIRFFIFLIQNYRKAIRLLSRRPICRDDVYYHTIIFIFLSRALYVIDLSLACIESKDTMSNSSSRSSYTAFSSNSMKSGAKALQPSVIVVLHW